MIEKIREEGNEEFLQKYFELLINRLTHSSMSLEEDLGNVDDSRNAYALKDCMEALKMLLEYQNTKEPLDLDTIIAIGNKINESSMYTSLGFRKIGNYLAETSIPISNPKDIQKQMQQLLLDYQTTWKDLDPFLREAKFHITFIHIHPFEDGNGRVSRLLLNYNLLQAGQMPAIITSDLVEYYQDYIRREDEEAMAHLFRIQSQKEKEVITNLYNQETQKKHFSSKK